MQDPFGIAVGLFPPAKDQFEGGLELDARRRVLGHRTICRIPFILPVHDRRHALESAHHLGFVDDTVVQPVGDMLARDAQRGSILHQADIVDIRHLRAADTLSDPARDIAQDPLDAIVEFLSDFLFRQGLALVEQGDGEDIVQRRSGPSGGDLSLPVDHVDEVIVRGVQGGGGRGGHPSGIRPRLGMGDFLFHHRRHGIRGGPHSFADLGFAEESLAKAGIDIPILVGADPLGRFHAGLGDDGSGFHRGMDLVPGAIEESGVDEANAIRPVFAGGGDARPQVDGGTPLLVHDADLDGAVGQIQLFFDPFEEFDGGGDFLRPVEFGLDDIEMPFAAIGKAEVAAVQVATSGEGGDHGIEKALGDPPTLLVEHGIGIHMQADIAHQHQASAGQGDRLSGGAAPRPIRIQPPLDGPSPLFEFGIEASFHQPQPVAVDAGLVVGIHGAHRILAILDGGDRRFEHDIFDPGGVQSPRRVLPIDMQLDMQAMIAKEQGSGGVGVPPPFAVADPFPAIGESGATSVLEPYLQRGPVFAGGGGRDDGVGGDIGVGAGFERQCAIQEAHGPGDHLPPSLRIEAACAALPSAGNDIASVKRIEKASPAGVGGVEGIAGVVDGDHQLRTGEARDLAPRSPVIGVVFVIAERWIGLRKGIERHDIADGFQEGAVIGGVESASLSAKRQMPIIDLRLQPIAFFEQGPIGGAEFLDNFP
uniref:Uncharacterized protein n=1 Tax=Amphimedon queenslandica TaxID=400682 RepID=A0A1X7TJ97_AMPQE